MSNTVSSLGDFDVVKIQTFQERHLTHLLFVELPLRNPSFELQDSSFGLQLFNSTRKIISSQKLNIGTIRILPNKLRSVSIEKIKKDFELSTNEKHWFLLRFTLSNSITKGSQIQIEIPKKLNLLNKMFLGQTQSVILDKGFESAFLNNQLQVT
jgi:hypothetical protein